MLIIFILLVLAYLLGSIPTSVWVGKKFYGIDVREYGSGNAGATNTFRVLGWKAGLPVFIFDMFKGFAAVTLVAFLDVPHASNTFISYQLAFGAAAVLGHIFPVFAQFKGGKGVATLLGVVIALSPIPAIMAFIIFVIVLLLFKYVSLGSIIAGISYPLIIWFVFPSNPIVLKIASVVMAISLILTHRKNIIRLINGTESKATFLFKNKS